MKLRALWKSLRNSLLVTFSIRPISNALQINFWHFLVKASDLDLRKVCETQSNPTNPIKYAIVFSIKGNEDYMRLFMATFYQIKMFS